MCVNERNTLHWREREIEREREIKREGGRKGDRKSQRNGLKNECVLKKNILIFFF